LPFPLSLCGGIVEDVEDESTGDRTGLGEPHVNLLGEAKREAGPLSSQRLLPFVVSPIIVWQRAHGHEPAGTAFRDCDEKSEARHTGNSRCEIRANFVCHVCSKVTVYRIALG
jgi:hypothetical protein